MRPHREDNPSSTLRFEYWDTVRHERPELKWLIEGLLPLGTLALMAYRPFSGGPELAMMLARQISLGEPFAGMPTTKRNVLYLAGCRPREETERMLRDLPPDASEDPMPFPDWATPPRKGAIPLYVHYGKYSLDTDLNRGELAECMAQWEAGLVVVDNLASAVHPKCLRDGRSAAVMMRELRTLVLDTGCTVLLLHHLAKYGGRVRPGGHPEVTEGAMSLLSVEAGLDSQRRRLLRMDVQGGGRNPGRAVYLRMPSPGAYEVAEPALEVPVGTLQERILDLLSIHPKTANQIAVEGGMIRGCVQIVLQRLVKAGLAEYGPKRGKAFTYVVSASQSDFKALGACPPGNPHP